MIQHEDRIRWGLMGAKAKWSKQPSAADRFWKNVKCLGKDDCWPWLRCKYPTGYGQSKMGAKKIGSHRRAYIHAFGEIPAGLFVLHKCDNPIYCNPAHLFLGTHTDNMRDAIKKGRLALRPHPEKMWHALGLRSPLAKVSDDEIRKIRELYAGGGITQKELSKMFGVGQDEISRIVNRKRWANVV